jgi:hypothetical protein
VDDEFTEHALYARLVLTSERKIGLKLTPCDLRCVPLRQCMCSLKLYIWNRLNWSETAWMLAFSFGCSTSTPGASLINGLACWCTPLTNVLNHHLMRFRFADSLSPGCHVSIFSVSPVTRVCWTSRGILASSSTVSNGFNTIVQGN